MTEETELSIRLKKMGYTPFTVKKEKPNFYELEDGTILKVNPILNGIIVKNEKAPESAQVNIQNYGATFVSLKNRGKPNFDRISVEEAIRMENIEKMDLQFKIISEHFNEYVVDNKWILSIKTTLSQVNRSKMRNNIGEPIYGFNASPVVKFKPKGKR